MGHALVAGGGRHEFARDLQFEPPSTAILKPQDSALAGLWAAVAAKADPPERGWTRRMAAVVVQPGSAIPHATRVDAETRAGPRDDRFSVREGELFG